MHGIHLGDQPGQVQLVVGVPTETGHQSVITTWSYGARRFTSDFQVTFRGGRVVQLSGSAFNLGSKDFGPEVGQPWDSAEFLGPWIDLDDDDSGPYSSYRWQFPERLPTVRSDVNRFADGGVVTVMADEEPFFVRSYPWWLNGAAYVLAAELTWLPVFFLGFGETAQLLIALAGAVVFGFRLARLLRFPEPPPPCPVCLAQGRAKRWSAYMAFFGDEGDPSTWQRLFFCSKCLVCTWVGRGPKEVTYLQPPEFLERTKRFEEGWFGGCWVWSASASESGWPG